MNLIPFGWNPDTGRHMDVMEVPNGSRSGCICPSCKIPLIAKHSKKITSHFAHASHAVYAKAKKECEYSVYVSIRMMARQVLSDGIEMSFPDYFETIGEAVAETEDVITERVRIAKQSRILISKTKVEEKYHNVLVDVVGDIGRYKMILYLTHPNRAVPPALLEIRDRSCGIVNIELQKLMSLMFDENEEKRAYLDILKTFLSEDIQSKSWIYHPRSEDVLVEAKKRLKARVLLEDEKAKRSLSNFVCRNCGNTWRGQLPRDGSCSTCNTHLYVVELQEYL